MTKKNITEETFETAVELTQKSAHIALKGAVQTTEVAEGFVQGLYKAGYETNVEALKIARNYWDASSQIRQDWIKLFAVTGEAFISSAAKMELPLQKEVAEFGKTVVANMEKTVGDMTAQTKAPTK